MLNLRQVLSTVLLCAASISIAQPCKDFDFTEPKVQPLRSSSRNEFDAQGNPNPKGKPIEFDQSEVRIYPCPNDGNKMCADFIADPTFFKTSTLRLSNSGSLPNLNPNGGHIEFDRNGRITKFEPLDLKRSKISPAIKEPLLQRYLKIADTTNRPLGLNRLTTLTGWSNQEKLREEVSKRTGQEYRDAFDLAYAYALSEGQKDSGTPIAPEFFAGYGFPVYERFSSREYEELTRLMNDPSVTDFLADSIDYSEQNFETNYFKRLQADVLKEERKLKEAQKLYKAESKAVAKYDNEFPYNFFEVWYAQDRRAAEDKQRAAKKNVEDQKVHANLANRAVEAARAGAPNANSRVFQMRQASSSDGSRAFGRAPEAGARGATVAMAAQVVDQIRRTLKCD